MKRMGDAMRGQKMGQALRSLSAWSICMMSACMPAQEAPEAPDAERAEAVAPVLWGEVEAVRGEGAFELCRGAQCERVTSGARVFLGDTITTDSTSRAALKLEDGSMVRLDIDTRLSIADRGRLKVESGEVVVDVLSDLAIETPAGEVVASAGRVSLSTSPERAVVGVMAGQVELRVAELVRALSAGEAASLEGAREIRHMPSLDLAYRTAWARDVVVEAEAESGRARGQGIGTITGKDPATRRILPEAITIPSMDVKVRVREQVARTEIEQTFRNTTGKTLEGIYTFPLPHDASIVRFAMEIGGKMMEGEIVEKNRAVKIFNSVVADYMRPKDPALLEWKGGNTFQLRIFPIFPKATQRVILWYTQPLASSDAGSRFTYPLPRTGTIGVDRFSFSADVQAGHSLTSLRTPMYASSIDLKAQNTRALVSFQKDNFHPRQDLVIQWAAQQPKGATIYTAADAEDGAPYFMMVLRPSFEQLEGLKGAAPRSPQEGRDHLFTVDTSYGTHVGDLKAQVAAVAAWLSMLGPADRFSIMACDQTQRLFREKPTPVTREKVQEALAFLESLKVGGASDLEGMYREAASHLSDSKNPVMVVMGDGQPTIGETRHQPLIESVDGLLSSLPRLRLHAVGIGQDVNVPLLEVLGRRFGGKVMVLNRGEDVPTRIIDMALDTQRPALRQAALAFNSELVEMVYPARLPTLSVGEEIVILGRFKGAVDSVVTLTGLVGEEAFAQPFRVQFDAATARDASFVPRLWARQHIEHLTHYGGPESHAAIIAASRRHSVMSRLTTFLVLENERMYKRFKVKRDRDRSYWDPDAASVGDGAVDGAPDSEESSLARDIAASPSARSPGLSSGFEEDEVKGEASKSPAAASKPATGGAAPRRPRARKSRPSAAPRMGFSDGLGDFSPPEWRPRPKRPMLTVRSLPAEPSMASDARARKLRELIKDNPLSRSHRRRLVNHLTRRGDVEAAHLALEQWLESDPDNPVIHWRLADLRARRAESDAERHFGSAVELAPSEVKPLESWALHLLMRKDFRLSSAVYKALFARTGEAGHALDLVAVEAMVDPMSARRLLARLRVSFGAGLTREEVARADALSGVLSSGRGDPLAGMLGGGRKLRGSAVVTMGWEGEVDLDLSVTLSSGERVSLDMPMSLRKNRGYVAAHAELGHVPGAEGATPLEAIVLPFFPVGGVNAIEIVRRGDLSEPVDAWVKVRSKGTSRTFRVTIPAGERDVRVAHFSLQYR